MADEDLTPNEQAQADRHARLLIGISPKVIKAAAAKAEQAAIQRQEKFEADRAAAKAAGRTLGKSPARMF